MSVTIYENSNDFLKENMKSLLMKEAVSQLIIFNAMANKDKTLDKENFFGKIVDEEEHLELIFCNVLPYNLLIYSVTSNVSERSIHQIVDYLITNKLVINGINANSLIGKLFLDYYSSKVNCEFREYLAMDIMELRTLNKVILTEGTTRLATPNDADLIARWEIEFALEALGEKLNEETLMGKVKKQIDSNIFYLFENTEHKVVTMAAASRKLFNGVSVNYVYTPKEYRGNGYAMTNVYHLSDTLLNAGNQFISLFVDKKNPISNRVYKKVGFEIIEDCFDYRIYRKKEESIDLIPKS